MKSGHHKMNDVHTCIGQMGRVRVHAHVVDINVCCDSKIHYPCT